jgi:3-oxoacyl-[acyl-carrier protein] reductase
MDRMAADNARSLQGRVALITGSGRGMGRCHAELLAERGAAVIVHDVMPEGAEETGKLIRDKGGKAHVIVADVTDTAAMAEAIRAGEKALGPVDILVNNAGIGAERTGIEDVTPDWFQRMFDVHVKGAFFATQAVVPGMKARKRGKIVNVSSIWGQTGHEYGATYCAAKAALIGLTKAWAKELAPWNINVNSLAPGAVITELTLRKGGMDYIREKSKAVPAGRFAEAVEMAYTVGFLCSGESDFMTGQLISVNGGQVIVVI